jgi:hypothetical protein
MELVRLEITLIISMYGVYYIYFSFKRSDFEWTDFFKIEYEIRNGLQFDNSKRENHIRKKSKYVATDTTFFHE